MTQYRLQNRHLVSKAVQDGCRQVPNSMKSKPFHLCAITYHSWLNLVRIALARAKAADNERPIDIDKLYSMALADKFKILSGWTKRTFAELLLCIGNDYLSDAEDGSCGPSKRIKKTVWRINWAWILPSAPQFLNEKVKHQKPKQVLLMPSLF